MVDGVVDGIAEEGVHDKKSEHLNFRLGLSLSA